MLSIAALSLITMVHQTYALSPDPFDNLSNWAIVSGSPQLDPSDIAPNPPSLKMGDTIRGDSTFGNGTDSIYLSHPITTEFQNGNIDFDIFFDNDPGAGDRAVITFRMLDPNTYYGVVLSNTQNWNSTFLVVRDRQVRTIGSESAVQLFATRIWSHVTLQIQGSQFVALINGKPVFSANDQSWSEGKWGGVGIYSAYYGGIFHIDNFLVASNPSTSTLPIPGIVTSTTTTTISSTNVNPGETSTSMEITIYTSKTTITSAVIQGAVFTVYETTSVGIISVPETTWGLPEQMILIAIGAIFALFGDFDLEKRSRVLEFAAILMGVIASAYLFSLGPFGLTWLWPLLIGVSAGVILRKTWNWWNS